MSYRVQWALRLRDELQRIYDDSADKQAVLNAVTRIGLELAAAPQTAGESREHDVRVLFKYPLIVWFRVDERMREVLIIKVRSYSQ